MREQYKHLLRRPFSENYNGLEPNDLGKRQTRWEYLGSARPILSVFIRRLVTPQTPSRCVTLLTRGRHLQPHIRAAIVTLVDAGLPQQPFDGGQS